MSAFYERTTMQEGLVKVTNRRLLVGTAIYAMSDIKSIRVIKRERISWPVWLVAAGLFFVLWAFVDQTGYFGPFFTLGVLLIILGLALLLTARASYVIQIRNRRGKTDDIFGSTDLALIERIVTAINQASAGRITQSGNEIHQSVDDIFGRA